jgi:hypothetical protein
LHDLLTIIDAAIYLNQVLPSPERKEAIDMKKILSLLTGLAFVLSFGLAFAADNAGETSGTDNTDKMIRDDDLSHSNLDQDKGTVNQMPEGSVEGSGAGGTSKDSESFSKTPVEKSPEEPAKGSGTGGESKDSGSWGY